MMHDELERVFKSIDSLLSDVDRIKRDLHETKDTIKAYADFGDEKTEARLGEKLEAFLIKVDNIKADAYDDVKELREDIKEQRRSDANGRRWFIAIILSLTMTAIASVGGYFISTEVTSTRVDNLEDKVSLNTLWQTNHHDKLEQSHTRSLSNANENKQLREDFRTYVKKEK